MDERDTVRRSFHAPAEGYDRLMGRYLPTLGPALADVAGVAAGQRVLDVGCGPGGLTAELVQRVGPDRVAAVDPSPQFAQACRERNPGVDVHVAVAEDLPFADARFDATLASLVVGFMTDRLAGLREMVRVTAPGGVVAACFWAHDQMELIDRFWSAVADVQPGHPGESLLFGRREGELASLFVDAGLDDVRQSLLEASAGYSDFDDWWGPLTFGIGPAGAYCRSLDDATREAVRRAARRRFDSPDEPFTLHAHAWCAVGRTPA
ncbi:Methyltransferase type 11 [Nostocoides japonicum T1-X7]|uniref:Methyltransferase type 11 n=1 Tax=Nostocoides japonicum T1-X7 TaxID=1194083 RepID=A0A077LXA8_9MICO|nr:class I SAM-dependent methyltransferase [Tetrasphaera japonica]CCH76619.1 Methyltransferase type 11 [Tetrasphaera japonica T1-X7]